MNKDRIALYKINSEKEKKIWENAIFVFDSSALLDFYFLPKNTREKVYIEVFSKLPERLWMPSHVEYEFLKNRESAILNPIKEKYAPLREKISNLNKELSIKVIKRIDEISRETLKEDKHPFIDQSEIEKIRSSFKNFDKDLKAFENNIFKQIQSAEKEISDVSEDDDLLKALEDFFTVGREFTFDEILAVTKEGKHRYEFKIPPGYGDLCKKEKKGTQIFGDLIIWKQILEFSKEKQLPIILILNDITKDDDWCYLDTNNKERISTPREELIKEIKDYSNVDFWMYSLPQFLFHANKYLSADFSEQTIQTISQFIHNKNLSGNSLKFKCNHCKAIHKVYKSDLDLDFECVEVNERNMGSENHYEATKDFECDCGNEILATFEIWEYPIGVHNYDDIDLEGAELLEKFSPSIDFYAKEYEPEYIKCHECDGNNEGDGNIVPLWDKTELLNAAEQTSEVISGSCQWCNTLHIQCPKCESINSFPLEELDKEKECEGGCGLIFLADSSEDTSHVGEFKLKFINPRD